MTAQEFWDVIDRARAAAGNGGQVAMLDAVKEQLSEFPSEEIVSWRSIQEFYLKLADCENLWKAADRCGIYLSDDAFEYMRAWLVSLGKEAYSSVMQDPKKLALYVDDPRQADFELFLYVSNDVYPETRLEETYGFVDAEQFKRDWLAVHSNKTEASFDWMLMRRFNIYDACVQNPLSDEEKEMLRAVVAEEAVALGEVMVVQCRAAECLEGVILDLFPEKDAEYRMISALFDKGSEQGGGSSQAAEKRFYQEMDELFGGAGWERISPVPGDVSPRYCKGESFLYCQPEKVSGPCADHLMSEVIGLLDQASTCTLLGIRDEGRVFDLSRAEYFAVLEAVRSDIEDDLLREFSEDAPGTDTEIRERVVRKYRVLTFDDHTSSLASFQPYWKFTERVLDGLVERGEIVEKEGISLGRGRHYVTEFWELGAEGLDRQIEAAKGKVSDAKDLPKRPDVPVL